MRPSSCKGKFKFEGKALSPIDFIINQLQHDLASYRSLAIAFAASPLMATHIEKVIQALEQMIIDLRERG